MVICSFVFVLFLVFKNLFYLKRRCFSMSYLLMIEFPKVFNKQSVSAPIEVSNELTVDIYENNNKSLFSDFEKSCSIIVPRNSSFL